MSELEGKLVGLYFSLSSYKACQEFTTTLAEVYEELRAKGESFEIVMISLDDEEQSFKKYFESMPWFALPFNDKSCGKLARYFKLRVLPTLVVIGQDGKTLHSNVAEAIEQHGIQAYPFTPEKFVELEEIEKAKREAQTLESILVSGDTDFVIGKDGVKVRSAFTGCVNICSMFLNETGHPISFSHFALFRPNQLQIALVTDSSVSPSREEHPPIFLSTLVPPMPRFPTKTYRSIPEY